MFGVFLSTCVLVLGLSPFTQSQQNNDIWRYSACSVQYGGRCSQNCYTNEQSFSSFYCFYGIAQCCIPKTVSCKQFGGTCRLGCGNDIVVSDRSVTCSGRQYCCIPNARQPTQTPKTSVAQRQGACGALNRVATTRILNGYTPRQCEWPWMVSLRHATRGLFCSGVLVDDDTVLTAAHCVVNAPIQEIRVHMGDNNINLQDYKETTSFVKSIDIMDGYKFEVKGRNLALLKLKSPVKFDECKKAACLRDSSIPLRPNSKCYVAGFGKTQYGRPASLQSADVTLIDKTICQNLVRFTTGEIPPTDVICSNADFDNTDACRGDDGGMLVCLDKQNRWALTGLVAYYSCNRYPTLYTDITQYTDWILNRL